jgi:hypothetical protein
VAAVALAVVTFGASRSDALVDDPYTSFTQPANALVMPFDGTADWTSFSIVSNIAGTSPTSGGEILGVTTHWVWWSEDCDHLVDVWVCLTLNDTIVVDPCDVSSVDVGNTQIGPATNLCDESRGGVGDGHRGFVVVTAYETDEICSDGSIRGFIPVDNAIVGAATLANLEIGYSFGNDAIGLGLDFTDSFTQLPKNKSEDIEIMTFNPTTVDDSSVVLISLEEQAGSGGTSDIEVGPNQSNKSANVVIYDNLEVATSLPDHSVRCADFTTMVPGADNGLIPGTIAVDSSGFVRLIGLNDDDEEMVYAIHGQSVSNFGGSNYGKYLMETFE